MNRALFHICAIVALVATTIATSCSREETHDLAVPSHSILVSMPGESGTTSFDSSNITSLEPTTVPKGWSVKEINMYAATITVTAPASFDNEEVESGTLSLRGYRPRVTPQLLMYMSLSCPMRWTTVVSLQTAMWHVSPRHAISLTLCAVVMARLHSLRQT